MEIPADVTPSRIPFVTDIPADEVSTSAVMPCGTVCGKRRRGGVRRKSLPRVRGPLGEGVIDTG